MNNFVSGLFLICVLTSTTNPSLSEEDVKHTLANDGLQESPEKILNINTSLDRKDTEEEVIPNEGRSISDTLDVEDNDAGVGKQSKPLRSIFLGIYKNYKSTYLGNKTLTEYKQTLRETMKNKLQQQQEQEQQDPDDNQSLEAEIQENAADDNDGIVTEYPEVDADEEHLELTTILTPAKQELSPNRKRKNTQKNSKLPKENATKIEPSPQQKQQHQHQQYNIGPALNLSLDIDNSIVKVNLDGESLKELVTGRWLNDNTEEGRGKKYEMVTRILPLFILPFLIQSAIIPFLVTKLKLLLIKSMLVGKLAIFLLIISAFRNSNKMMQTYEVAPSYWAGEPSRRSELAAAASNMAYNGYRVEGKPAAWIN